MENKNFYQYVQSLRDLPMFLALGYVNEEHGQKIDKFSRAELQNGVVATLSSFNENTNVNTFKPFNDNLDDLFIESDNIADTHEITIYYISENNGIREQKEAIVTLQGATQVNISTLFNDNIYCVWRMRNKTGTPNVGTVSIVDGSANIYCNMPITTGVVTNSSLTGIYSVPTGYIALLIDVSLNLDKGADAKGAIFTRKKGGVFIYQKALSSFEKQSIYRDIFLVVDENTDIHPIAVAQTGGVAYLDYTILLLKKEFVGQNFKV